MPDGIRLAAKAYAPSGHTAFAFFFLNFCTSNITPAHAKLITEDFSCAIIQTK